MLIGSLLPTFRRSWLPTMKAETASLSEKSAADRSTKVIYRNAVIPVTNSVKEVYITHVDVFGRSVEWDLSSVEVLGLVMDV